MKAIRLLQLGDIHYPDHRQESTIDAKDGAFPQGLQDLTQLNPLQAVMRRVSQTEADFVLLCGDITTRGDIQQYDDCLTYLFQNLDLAGRGADAIHVVPGNHDVDRSKVDPAGQDLYGKFASFAQLWENRGLPILTVKAPRETTLNKNAVTTTVISLNSSLGCGEQYFPLEVREEMRALLKEYESKSSPESGFAVAGQSLDTPLIKNPDIEEACEIIRFLDQATIPVVVAHHNLLPQATPRIALYTELLNGGLVRSRLSTLGRALVYCHGHIHENPIEIVQDPRSEKSKLISVAAPELARGFNLLTLEFSSKGIPLGCVVDCYRFNKTNASLDTESFRIPLQSAANRLKHLPQKLEAVLKRIPQQGIRFTELNNAAGKMPTKNLQELLLEAEWLGFLRIDDRDEAPQYWQIRSYSS